VVGLGLAFALLLVGLPSLVGWSGVTRSPVAGAVGATLFFLLFSPVYRRVRERVDRIFLRAGVAEAERLRSLRDLADGVRTEELSAALERGIDAVSSFHAVRTQIWTAGADGSYGPFGAGTGTVTADSLPPESALVTALQGGSSGVEGASDGRLATEAQRELSDRGLALASPIVANDRLQGFVALGRKRNGTAYSKEDRDFVEMVASHLAIAFERSSGRTVRLGPYRIRERLGTGGMAEVFLAEKQGPGGFELRVALKRMLPHLGDDPDCVAMFLDEARIAAQLGHPNIVRIHDIESLQGRYFIAMEYVDGATLAELIRTARQRGEVLPLEVCAAITVAMLRALRYAHTLEDRHGRRLGLVHRDVKPGNLLIGRQGEIKLGDFGIARAEFRLYRTEPGHARGTLPYMAPELWHGRVAPAADLFSAGAVVYEMVTGEVAFPEGAAESLFVPPTDRRPELPSGLDSFLERALAREPAARFATAEAMEEAFLRAISPVTPAQGRAVAAVVDASCRPATSPPPPDPSVLVDDRPAATTVVESAAPADDLPPTERR
jgi:serine/threonine-protein kinase